MDHAFYNVIYVDRRAKDQSAKRASLLSADRLANGLPENHPDVQAAVDALLSVFNQVQVCSSGSSCLDRISDLDSAAKAPTLVLVDIPPKEARQAWTGHDRQKQTDSTEPGDIYGIRLLSNLGTDIRSKKLSKLIVPIAVVDVPDRETESEIPERQQASLDDARFMRLVDAGAVDVLTRPISGDRVRNLAILGYRMFRDYTKSNTSFLASKRQRKMSWVGVEPEKPYSYLREAMVSNLMSGICSPEPDPQFDIWNAMRSARLDPADEDDRLGERDSISGISQSWLRRLTDDRKAAVAEAIGYWSFSAHDFSDDELLYAALLMLQHTLQMPELAPWDASADDLVVYLHACRSSYNDFVHYHNFRHVVDVLQAVFHFLVQLRTIPPYPQHDSRSPPEECVLASILEPFDALTLLVSAIGHDVGHPGVNNAFLVSLNAPLAQLFNDRSVLESFHCASYSQVLRRHWPAVFRDTKMRRLMINSILATDMGVHFKYMEDLNALQRILKSDGKAVERWDPKEKEKYRDLICALLIKCADISNIARVFPVARKWADILNEEFAHQGEMEVDLGIRSCLAGGPPTLGDDIKLGKSQQGFMNMFALPLFQEVSALLPDMKYSVVELERNRAAWEKCVAQLALHTGCCTSAKCEKLLGVVPSQSDAQSPRSLGEASSHAATQTSTDCSSANGTATFSPSPITPTSPPAQVSDVLQKVPTNEPPARGRLQKMNGNSQPIALHVPARGNKTKSQQRASSAHQSRRRHDEDAAEPMPNGILNPSFVASETDVRYLGNSESVPSNPDEKGETALKPKGLERKLTQSFKRLWKKRWRPGDKKMAVQVAAK